MGILDNFESAWDTEFSFESSSSKDNISTDTCCNGCGCKSSEDHKSS